VNKTSVSCPLGWSRSQRIYIKVVKRLLDLLLALVALPFVLLVVILVAPMIYIEDRGPIFYCSDRIGRNGKLFRMYKLRSMKVNAPDIRLADGSTYNGADDPRVTKIGALIRKTSLDELPQVFNVLVGHMSFIGPRPDPPDWIDRYPEGVKSFLTVKPGISGYNQAYFRNLADSENKMKNDVYYAEKCSLILDLKILFKTIIIVLLQRNTYKCTEKDGKVLDFTIVDEHERINTEDKVGAKVSK